MAVDESYHHAVSEYLVCTCVMVSRVLLSPACPSLCGFLTVVCSVRIVRMYRFRFTALDVHVAWLHDIGSVGHVLWFKVRAALFCGPRMVCKEAQRQASPSDRQYGIITRLKASWL